MQRTLLVVDDADSNRELLKKILGDEYEVLQAADGREAMAALRSSTRPLSAVLLDLAMPVMDGFEVLRLMHEDEKLAGIPVLVTTGLTEEESEVRALELGANDYITKPYNAAIIKRRLKNTISLRESAATVSALQRDVLTGLYNREIFFERAKKLIDDHEEGYYVMASFNVDSFKVVNDQYGLENGDRVLKHIANCFDRCMSTLGGICCRVMADSFAVMYPSSAMDSGELERCREEASAPDFISHPISIRIGRYIVSDKSISASAMYDRATMAENSVKGRYDVFVAMYDESMRMRILREQDIVNEMNGALAGGQFEVWFQPQFNHATGALIGAEALVRWRHPQKGIIPPGEFISVFERNGFVYELDKYVWEQACRYLSRWRAEGSEPLPVSVNISRYDLFREDFLGVLTGLVEKYDIPAGLLRLEITESAFADAPDHIIEVVEQLKKKGFTVEIDDFGSGYSSLNTLKDVPADILKLDMRFLESSRNSERGGNILESIVRMAKWLGMPVIAEGVETVEQAEFLKSIGCCFIQGYLYARPMPAEDYEELSRAYDSEQEMLTLELAENLNNNTFWDPKSMETLIFNSYVGGACICEYNNGKLEMLRSNSNYARVLGDGRLSQTQAQSLALLKYMDKESLERMRSCLHRAMDTGAETSGEACLDGMLGEGEKTYIRAAMRVIARADSRCLIYCSIINITPLREAQRKEQEALERMESQQKELLDNLPGGAALYRLTDTTLRAEHLNKRYRELVGRSIDDPGKASVMGAVHPDDREAVMNEVRLAVAEERDIDCVLRLRHGDSRDEYRPFQTNGRIIENSDGTYSIYATFLQLSPEKTTLMELLPLVLDAIMDSTSDLSFAKDRDFRYLCGSRPFVQMAGLESERDLLGKTDYDLFERATADKFRRDDEQLMESGESIIDMLEAIPSGDGVQHCSSTSKYLLRDALGNIIGLYGVGRDVTEYNTAFEQLKLLTESIPGGIASFEVTPRGLRNIYFNEGFYDFSGYTREEYGEICHADPWGLIFREDLSPLLEGLQRIRNGQVKLPDYVYRCHTKDGGCRWMSMKVAVSEAHGDTFIVNAVRFDITERKQSDEMLRMSEEQYRLAMKQSGTIMCRYNVADRSESMNADTAAIFDTSERVLDVPYSMVKAGLISPDSTAAYVDFYEGILRGEKTGTAEFERKTTLGWRWLKAHQSSIFSDDGKPVYAVISFFDNTERHRQEEEHAALLQNERILRHKASTDGLTGIFNKSVTETKIMERLSGCGGSACTLLIADIDDLKLINDTLGHPQGDRAIRAIADILEAHFRRSDIVGRIGGDEFIVFLEGVPGGEIISEMLSSLLEHIKTVKIGAQDDYAISLSIGAATVEGEQVPFEELYSRADRALYRAKRNGKRQFALYSPELD